MLTEAVQIIKMLFTQETTSFEGKYYNFRNAYCEPKPVNKSLPIWIGAMGEKFSLPLVGRYADGWNTFLMDINQYKTKLEVVKNSAASAKRDPDEIRKAIVFNAVLGESQTDALDNLKKRAQDLQLDQDQLKNSAFVGTIDDLRQILDPYIKLGVKDFLLLATPPLDSKTLSELSKLKALL
jgi:alkanesulfonate monooxygenase SsuD/methylene tetrahydromethanopterin reductase-like flavin-dependent oxidoreductase (luciferase family)